LASLIDGSIVGVQLANEKCTFDFIGRVGGSLQRYCYEIGFLGVVAEEVVQKTTARRRTCLVDEGIDGRK
jgi:hypothetical protein